MKRIPILLTVFFAVAIIFYNCGGSPRDEIVGTWEAVDVSAELNDYTNIKSKVLDQTLEYYRTVQFEFFEDFTMNIISSGNSFPGTWKFNEKEKAVYIRMDQHEAKDYKKLGVLAKDTIVSNNETGIGEIIVDYVKVSQYN